MRHSLRFLSALLTAIITLMTALPSSYAQPYGADEVQPPREEHAMKRLWRDIDQVNFEIDQIQIYTRYCKPPNGPNIADTQWEIDFVAAKYRRLQETFDRFFQAYEQAIKSRLAAGYRSTFPTLKGMTADNRDYWATTSGTLAALANKIEAKQAALNKKKEENCADDNRPPPPPPPPPPADWFKGLSRPVAPPVPFAELPPHFCTDLEKTQWILNNVSPARVLAAENARHAAGYMVDIGKRMRELETKRIFEPLTADEQRGLKELSAEYKWAQDNLAEQDRVVKEIDAYAAKAWAIKIIDCRTDQPQTEDAEPIPQPDYEMFVYPQVPPRFCSEEEKQYTLNQLQFAKDAARRNYEKAKAHVASLDARLKAGDKTPGLPEALHQARQAETTYYNLWIELDRAYQKAKAMPVVDCGPPPGDDKGVLRGAKVGAEAGTTAPPPVTPPPTPPPPAPPATGTGKAKEVGARDDVTTDEQYAARLEYYFGDLNVGSGGFFGYEVSPADRAVGAIQPNPTANVHGVSGIITIDLGPSWNTGASRVFGATGAEPFVRLEGSMFQGDAAAEGMFVTDGSTLLPGLGGPTEAGFILPDLVGFSNDIDWSYYTKSRAYDFNVAFGETLWCDPDDFGPRFDWAAIAGYYTATRRERMEFEIPDFVASGAYNIKSETDAPYLGLQASYKYPFDIGKDWTPYLKADLDARLYFYDASADVSFTPSFAAEHRRTLDDSGTELGWSAGIEAGVDIDSAAMQIYIGYRHVENELSPIANIPGGVDGAASLGVTTNDLDVVVVGARVRF